MKIFQPTFSDLIKFSQKPLLVYAVLLFFLTPAEAEKDYFNPEFKEQVKPGVKIAVIADYWAVQMDTSNHENELVLSKSCDLSKLAVDTIGLELKNLGFDPAISTFLVGYSEGVVQVDVVDTPEDSTIETQETPLYIDNSSWNQKPFNRALLGIFPALSNLDTARLLEIAKNADTEYAHLILPKQYEFQEEIYELHRFLDADFFLFLSGDVLIARKGEKAKDNLKSAGQAVFSALLTRGVLFGFNFKKRIHIGKMVLLDSEGIILWSHEYQATGGSPASTIKQKVKSAIQSAFKKSREGK